MFRRVLAVCIGATVIIIAATWSSAFRADEIFESSHVVSNSQSYELAQADTYQHKDLRPCKCNRRIIFCIDREEPEPVEDGEPSCYRQDWDYDDQGRMERYDELVLEGYYD